jgi:nitrite reductase [NAD(P)H] small subunit
MADRELAIFNLGDTFLATDNRCPHKAGPLCDGIVTGRSVVCPLHAWKINLESGAIERPGSADHFAVQTYPVRIDDGMVTVCLSAEGPVESDQAEKDQYCQIVKP